MLWVKRLLNTNGSVCFLLVINGYMRIETVTDILSQAHESLADSKSSASLET